MMMRRRGNHVLWRCRDVLNVSQRAPLPAARHA